MPQGHFNVLKGDYPGLLQRDSTLPVDSSETAIVRGSVIKQNGSGNWVRVTGADAGAANSPGPQVFLSLQDQSQPDVKFANGLTALSITSNLLVETDQYDTGATLAVGGYLACGANGKVTDHADDLTAIGVIVKSPYKRYSNDRYVVDGANQERTGTFIDVIAFWTLYIPNLSTS